MPLRGHFIRRAAVLGAGLMGAQMAAHLVNAGIEVWLFDSPASGGDPNGLIKQSLEALQTLKPPALARDNNILSIHPANYEHDKVLLRECDLIIEIIPERMDWKCDLWIQISPFLNENALLLSHTERLSVEKIASSLPLLLRSRFVGAHFYSPPRYSRLVEIIPHTGTDPSVLELIETFFVSRLGKQVIIAKDSPLFIGNRLGMFTLLASLYHAEQLGLAPDVIDLITGTLMGRPSTATYHSIDAQGLDIILQKTQAMERALINDPFRHYFKFPEWMEALVQKGILGDKTKAGIYRKSAEEWLVTDKSGQYRPTQLRLASEVASILKIQNPAERMDRLRNSDLPEAKFLWFTQRDFFHYCAHHLHTMAESAREIDNGVRNGLGFVQGPFEMWQAMGWRRVAQWIEQDINAKTSTITTPMPSWVHEVGEKGIYRGDTVYSPSRGIFIGPSRLPIYQRLQGFGSNHLSMEEETPLFETDHLRLWNGQEGIAILGFKSSHNIVEASVLEAILEAIAIASSNHHGLILLQESSEDFSLGSNLHALLQTTAKGSSGVQILLHTSKLLQKTCMALRYASIPTVAVLRGRVLGGGFELMMHCDRCVVALESYPGLVETSAGLIPMGGGVKEMAQRASFSSFNGDLSHLLNSYFDNISGNVVARSAQEAKQLGYLQSADIIVHHPAELLYVARKTALHLWDTNYQPPMRQKIVVAGKPGWAAMQVKLLKKHEAREISDHDLQVLGNLARVLCGGDVEGESLVTEEWMLDLERQCFLELVQTEKTQARIQHLLEYGRPLRN